ncbi:MAG: alanine racemase [Candidatus Bipolaricaulis sp.]|nr:alanine racemase [Candidatus Bipolaricaulis sp.]
MEVGRAEGEGWNRGHMVRAEVDTGVVRGNLERLRGWLPRRVSILFVVKEDAYGHGLLPVARAAQGIVDWFGVASLHEARALRRAKFKQPILIMTPPVGPSLVQAIREGYHLPLGDSGMIPELEAASARAGRRALVHIEVDTGMGRFGLLPEEVDQALSVIHPGRIEVAGVYSHLSSANGRSEEDLEFTRAQVWWFRHILKEWERRGIEIPWRHLANSAAVLAFDEATASPLNMVRVGTAAYGYPEGPMAPPVELIPAARAWTEIAAVRDLPRGWPVGYGRGYVTPGAARVAILAAGYGDGLRPELRRVVIRDQAASLVGKLGMDSVAADVTAIERIRRGDRALLFGPGVCGHEGWICPVLVPVLLSSHRRWTG